jgi:hypothetical protein
VAKAWLNLMQGRAERGPPCAKGFGRRVFTVLFRAAQQTAWINIIPVLPDEYGAPARDLPWSVFGTDSIDYYIAKANAYQTNPSKARAYYDSIAAWAAPRARRDPSEPQTRALRVTRIDDPR